jgi:hypothetical protein
MTTKCISPPRPESPGADLSPQLVDITQQTGAKKLPEKVRPRGAKDANLFRERLDAITPAGGRTQVR